MAAAQGLGEGAQGGLPRISGEGLFHTRHDGIQCCAGLLRVFRAGREDDLIEGAQPEGPFVGREVFVLPDLELAEPGLLRRQGLVQNFRQVVIRVRQSQRVVQRRRQRVHGGGIEVRGLIGRGMQCGDAHQHIGCLPPLFPAA